MAHKDKRGSVKAASCANMKRCMAVVLMLGMLPSAGLNAQQAASTTFRVAARVEESCVVSAHGTQLLRTTCTPHTTYFFALKRGAPRSAIPENSTARDAPIGVGTGLAVDHTLFGGIPDNRVVQAGDYPDTIAVHVYY